MCEVTWMALAILIIKPCVLLHMAVDFRQDGNKSSARNGAMQVAGVGKKGETSLEPR